MKLGDLWIYLAHDPDGRHKLVTPKGANKGWRAPGLMFSVWRRL